MLEKLKNFDPEKGDVDEMVVLSAFARNIAAEYAHLGIDQPEWLEVKHKEVLREVDTRLSDLRAKRIREIERSLAGLKSAEEKRADLKAELERLRSPRV